MRDLVRHYIGGGWGSDSQEEQTSPVRVIRGADFPAVAAGSMHGVPLRYEADKKLPSRTLQPGDIVLEISGGTKDRPTGRTVFISERLLDEVREAVIPASFCRLVRPDAERVEPRYLSYWLQDMYVQGRTWRYQVQSTGLANFQMEQFLDVEVVTLPPLDEQRRIAAVLGAFDDLIETNRKTWDHVRDLSGVLYADLVTRASDVDLLGSVARVSESKTKPGAGSIRYIDIAALGDGTLSVPEAIDWSGAPSRARMLASDGATLWSTVRPNRRAHTILVECPEDIVVSTGIAVIEPGSIGPAELFAACDTEEFLEHLMSRADGSAYPAVRASEFRTVPIPRLRDEDAATFESLLWPLWVDAHAGLLDNERLTRTRDELLPLLMSGRVRVEDVEGVA